MAEDIILISDVSMILVVLGMFLVAVFGNLHNLTSHLFALNLLSSWLQVHDIGVGSNSIFEGPNIIYTAIAAIWAACMNTNNVCILINYPPIFYPRDFINIHTCSADRRDCGVYYVQPPKMELLPTPMSCICSQLDRRLRANK